MMMTTSNVFPMHRSPFYRLNDDGSIDNVEWAELRELDGGLNKSLTRTTIQLDDHSVLISTVFLGVTVDLEEPALFETMIFGGDMSYSVWRYNSLEKAHSGHDEIVSALLDELKITPNDERVTHEYLHQRQRLH